MPKDEFLSPLFGGAFLFISASIIVPFLQIYENNLIFCRSIGLQGLQKYISALQSYEIFFIFLPSSCL